MEVRGIACSYYLGVDNETTNNDNNDSEQVTNYSDDSDDDSKDGGFTVDIEGYERIDLNVEQLEYYNYAIINQVTKFYL